MSAIPELFSERINGPGGLHADVLADSPGSGPTAPPLALEEWLHMAAGLLPAGAEVAITLPVGEKTRPGAAPGLPGAAGTPPPSGLPAPPEGAGVGLSLANFAAEATPEQVAEARLGGFLREAAQADRAQVRALRDQVEEAARRRAGPLGPEALGLVLQAAAAVALRSPPSLARTALIEAYLRHAGGAHQPVELSQAVFLALDPQMIQSLGQQWQSGTPIGELAKQAGTSWQSLVMTLLHAGFKKPGAVSPKKATTGDKPTPQAPATPPPAPAPPAPSATAPVPGSEEHLHQIAQKWLGGESIHKYASELGVSYQGLLFKLFKLGYTKKAKKAAGGPAGGSPAPSGAAGPAPLKPEVQAHVQALQEAIASGNASAAGQALDKATDTIDPKDWDSFKQALGVGDDEWVADWAEKMIAAAKAQAAKGQAPEAPAAPQPPAAPAKGKVEQAVEEAQAAMAQADGPDDLAHALAQINYKHDLNGPEYAAFKKELGIKLGQPFTDFAHEHFDHKAKVQAAVSAFQQALEEAKDAKDLHAKMSAKYLAATNGKGLAPELLKQVEAQLGVPEGQTIADHLEAQLKAKAATPPPAAGPAAKLTFSELPAWAPAPLQEAVKKAKQGLLQATTWEEATNAVVNHLVDFWGEDWEEAKKALGVPPNAKVDLWAKELWGDDPASKPVMSHEPQGEYPYQVTVPGVGPFGFKEAASQKAFAQAIEQAANPKALAESFQGTIQKIQQAKDQATSAIHLKYLLHSALTDLAQPSLYPLVKEAAGLDPDKTIALQATEVYQALQAQKAQKAPKAPQAPPAPELSPGAKALVDKVKQAIATSSFGADAAQAAWQALQDVDSEDEEEALQALGVGKGETITSWANKQWQEAQKAKADPQVAKAQKHAEAIQKALAAGHADQAHQAVMAAFHDLGSPKDGKALQALKEKLGLSANQSLIDWANEQKQKLAGAAPGPTAPATPAATSPYEAKAQKHAEAIQQAIAAGDLVTIDKAIHGALDELTHSDALQALKDKLGLAWDQTLNGWAYEQWKKAQAAQAPAATPPEPEAAPTDNSGPTQAQEQIGQELAAWAQQKGLALSELTPTKLQAFWAEAQQQGKNYHPLDVGKAGQFLKSGQLTVLPALPPEVATLPGPAQPLVQSIVGKLAAGTITEADTKAFHEQVKALGEEAKKQVYEALGISKAKDLWKVANQQLDMPAKLKALMPKPPPVESLHDQVLGLVASGGALSPSNPQAKKLLQQVVQLSPAQKGALAKALGVGSYATLSSILNGHTPPPSGLKAKAEQHLFPVDLSSLKKVKSLGGSTGGGAALMESEDGKKYVQKSGSSADHLKEEALADAAYQALGLAVPTFKVYDTPSGPVKVAQYIEGEDLGHFLAKATAPQKAAVLAELKKGFVADALLGNWDVHGQSGDNIKVQALPDGSIRVWRIDNGGSLRYRAQGAPKKGAWNGQLKELDSMRDKGQLAGKYYHDVTDAEIYKQAEEVLKKEQELLQALPKALHPVMKERLQSLRAWMAQHEPPSVVVAGFADDEVRKEIPASAFPKWLNEAGKAWNESLGPTEKSAISFYTGSGYDDLNGKPGKQPGLRDCPEPPHDCLTEPLRKKAAQVHKALKKSPPFALPIMVYRGVGPTGKKHLLAAAQAALASGKATLTMDGINSLSVNPQVAVGFARPERLAKGEGMILEIRARSGGYVSASGATISAVGQGEYEIVHGHRDRRYRVAGIVKRKYHLGYGYGTQEVDVLQLEELPDDAE